MQAVKLVGLPFSHWFLTQSTRIRRSFTPSLSGGSLDGASGDALWRPLANIIIARFGLNVNSKLQLKT